MINAIVAADFHHGAPNVEQFRRELYEWFFPSIEAIFRAMPVHYMVLAGDYYNHKMDMTAASTRLAFECFNSILAACYKYNCPLHVLRGTWSHDYDQMSLVEYDTRMYKLPDGRKLVHVYTQPQRVEVVPGYPVWMVPETYPENLDEYFALLREPAEAMHFHGRWDFAAFRDELLLTERSMRNAPVHMTADFAPLIRGPISGGHIHTGDTNGKVFYTRSLTRWAHGESEPKGYLVTSHEEHTSKFRVETVDNPMAIQYTTLVASSGREEEVFLRARELRASGHRVKIKTDNAASLAVLRQVAGSDLGIRVEIDTKNGSLYDLIATHYSTDHLTAIFSDPDPINTIIRFEQLTTNGECTPLERDFVARVIQRPQG